MKFSVTLLFSFLGMAATAQEYFDNNEAFDHLPEGRLRKEIACFSSFGEAENSKLIKPGKTAVIASGKNFFTFKRDSITVTVKDAPFDKTRHTFKKDEDGHVIAIDGKHVFGRDYDRKPPARVMQSIIVTIGADTLRLPKSAYFNLYEPTLFGHEGDLVSPHIYISPDKRRIYIFSMHSDGAGAYEVTWVIQDKKYLRRVVDFGY